MARILIAAAGIAVAAALFLVLRPDDDGSEAAPPAPTTTETGTTTVEPPPPSPPPPARVEIVVRGGKPVGGVRRVTVGKDRRVILTITSDVADHIHLHGYDVMRDVAPGRPATLDFRATIVGTVEVELEDRHVPLARIVTQP